MARKPPPEYTRWKPGQSGNASGKPKGLLTQNEISALIGRFWRLSSDQLELVLKDPKTTMGEAMIASVMLRAFKDGDFSRVEGLLTRGVGKVKDVSEVTHNYDEELKKVDREKIVELLKQG